MQDHVVMRPSHLRRALSHFFSFIVSLCNFSIWFSLTAVSKLFPDVSVPRKAPNASCPLPGQWWNADRQIAPCFLGACSGDRENTLINMKTTVKPNMGCWIYSSYSTSSTNILMSIVNCQLWYCQLKTNLSHINVEQWAKCQLKQYLPYGQL